MTLFTILEIREITKLVENKTWKRAKVYNREINLAENFVWICRDGRCRIVSENHTLSAENVIIFEREETTFEVRLFLLFSAIW